MKRYFDTLLRRSTGLPTASALLTVYVAGTSTLATLYDENDVASEQLDNPLETGVDGEFSFYIANGSYDFRIVQGTTDRLEPDIEIYDLGEMASDLDFVDRLTARGAVPDAQMVEDGEMTEGMSALTCASGPFTPGDVGKSIIVAGAGAADVKLKTTVAAYVSPTELTLSTDAVTTVAGAGVAWGTDCSAALQEALDALDGAKGGTLVIDGYFLLTEPVAKNFFQTVTTSQFNILGTGTNSAIIVAVDSSETALSLGLAAVDLRGISFVGVPGAVDAQRALFFNAGTLHLQQCQFIGLLTAGQPVCVTGSYFYSDHNAFGGTFCLTDGIGFSPSRSALYVDDWYAFSDLGSVFIDYGYWRGLLLSKSGSAGISAFVGIGTPNSSYTTSAARSAGVASFRDTAFDEGSARGVWVQPASGTITSLELIGTRHNVNDVEGASGVYASSVGNVLVDRCNFGLAPTEGTTFGEFVNCGRVILDSLTFLQGVSRVRATNVDALIVRDTDIEDFSIVDTNYFPESSAVGGLALVKAGPISDSDFPVAPGPMTKGFDSLNGRLYLRARGDWIYFNLAGGSLLGPELVPNGTGGSTTGWDSSGSTLSSVSGKLRVTITSAYGKGRESIPVEIGREYRFAADLTSGTGEAQVRVGNTLSGGEYVIRSTSGSNIFVATSATLHITLLVNAEASGRYADFDNISVRAT